MKKFGGIVIFAVLAAVVLFAAANSVQAADIVPVKQTIVVADSVAAVPVVKVRAYPYVRVFARPLVTTNVEVREAPRYTIVEQQSAPFVWNGVFRDRVVFPKRKQLSIEVK